MSYNSGENVYADFLGFNALRISTVRKVLQETARAWSGQGDEQTVIGYYLFRKHEIPTYD